MPFQIVRNDITRMDTDAIVNAANESLLGGGGVDGAIHRAAGPRLREACRKLGGCKTGEAKITPGFDLPCRWVIHTVGPVWQGGTHGERDLLASCYRNALALAREKGCESIAFPLISAGAYGYPREEALRVATDVIRDFLRDEEMQVYLVVFDRASFDIGRARFESIRSFIDDSYITPEWAYRETLRRPAMNRPPEGMPDVAPICAAEEAAPARPKASPRASGRPFSFTEGAPAPAPRPAPKPTSAPKPGPSAPIAKPGKYGPPTDRDLAKKETSLEDYLRKMDEGFRDMLLRKIDERGMTDAACYKLANVDRKLFNKIKNQPDYRPGKSTVLAFAVALRLPMPEVREMLEKAGFSLSHSSKFDLIVEYYILQGNYDVYEINEALFSFDQRLLGSAL